MGKAQDLIQPLISTLETPGDSKSLISIKDVLARIAVRPPYFALGNLHRIDKSTVEAQVPVEQACFNEAAVISAAEAVRHLAVLGSCATSMLNPVEEKHYYLARYAEYKALNFRLCKNEAFKVREKTLRGIAKGYRGDKRNAKTYAQLLTHSNALICELEIFYEIIPEPLFHKFYMDSHEHNLDFESKPDSIISILSGMKNPFKNSLLCRDMSINGNKLTGTIGIVEKELCRGHFPDYPVLPVPILVYNLLYSCGVLLQHQLKGMKAKYLIKEAIIDSKKPATAGERVDFETELAKESNNDFYFRSYSYSSDSSKIMTQTNGIITIV